MHTVWKGAISFGLVHVPVKMFSATEDKDISLRMIHKVCGGPIAYVRHCPNCETEVAWDDIVKGYEYEKGHYVLFEKEELEQIAGERSKTIQILDFVDLDEIDPIYFQKTYYLSPDQAGGNAYNLLMRAMSETGRIGIAKVSIRSKSSMAAIRVIDNCLAMETIFYPDEIRPVSQVPGLPEEVKVNDKELTMAKLLIEQLSTPFEPEKYTDDYRERLFDLISRKIAGEEVRIAPQQEPANVIDLMAALQASLESIRVSPEGGALDTGAAAKSGKTAGAGTGAKADAAKSTAKSAAKGKPAAKAGNDETDDNEAGRGKTGAARTKKAKETVS
ncbi:DNA repair protein [Paenibacillus sp. 32O-W]|uniref:non-homologous end joining protein Ku n=1 Tax=Paenibacillus sp. 32O-W TaxID=1695218 RepID=UPI00071FD7F4|nr:Ku protein [Paenibacillus sp. 32O-W]ALS29686.1 DNA repair protein [Paenibacillus sp. 32O-W]